MFVWAMDRHGLGPWPHGPQRPFQAKGQNTIAIYVKVERLPYRRLEKDLQQAKADMLAARAVRDDKLEIFGNRGGAMQDEWSIGVPA